MPNKKIIFLIYGLCSIIMYFFFFQNCSQQTFTSQLGQPAGGNSAETNPTAPVRTESLPDPAIELPAAKEKLLGADRIYPILNVVEVDSANGALGASVLKKMSGGLECSKITVVAPNAVPTYECIFDDSNRNFNQLYAALNLTEIAVDPNSLGATTLSKEIGGLKCSKVTVVYPNAVPNYTCEFQTIE